MWIKFTATDEMLKYNDTPRAWSSGDVRSVKKEESDRLCKTFPKNFQETSEPAIIEEKATEKDEKPTDGEKKNPDEEKSQVGKDKMQTGKDKGRR